MIVAHVGTNGKVYREATEAPGSYDVGGYRVSLRQYFINESISHLRVCCTEIKIDKNRLGSRRPSIVLTGGNNLSDGMGTGPRRSSCLNWCGLAATGRLALPQLYDSSLLADTYTLVFSVDSMSATTL